MATIVFLGALLLALAPLVWRAIRSEDAGAPVGLFVYLLIATPLAIGIAVDIWELNISTGRMNTVFKLYLQAWVLMALASAFILWRMRFGLELGERAAGTLGGPRRANLAEPGARASGGGARLSHSWHGRTGRKDASRISLRRAMA